MKNHAIEQANRSRRIESAQTAAYARLPEIVNKHIEFSYRKPFQDHNLQAFSRLVERLSKHTGPCILDSCCGTGMSSYQLAHLFPDTLVVGIDRSGARLARGINRQTEKRENCLLLHADCEDLWRLCALENIVFTRHTVFYPNPYPKNEHFKRRWHGHPVFPILAQLSKTLELRSNWQLYLQEFSVAWQILTGGPGLLSQFEPERYMTLFEQKYHQSGQALFRWVT